MGKEVCDFNARNFRQTFLPGKPADKTQRASLTLN